MTPAILIGLLVVLGLVIVGVGIAIMVSVISGVLHKEPKSRKVGW